MSAPIVFDGPADNTIVGLGIPFGGADQRDLEGQWFDARTDFALDLVEGDRPLLYQHGRDADVGGSVIGRITGYKLHSTGIWWQAQLDMASMYAAHIKELVRRGALGFSSGALGHLVKVEPDGRIAVWPWIEGSVTPTPASPLAKAYSVKSADARAHFEALSRITVDDRHDLRLIRAGLAGLEPTPGLVYAGMDGRYVIQSEPATRHA